MSGNLPDYLYMKDIFRKELIKYAMAHYHIPYGNEYELLLYVCVQCENVTIETTAPVEVTELAN
jgi:hypothetical protein